MQSLTKRIVMYSIGIISLAAFGYILYLIYFGTRFAQVVGEAMNNPLPVETLNISKLPWSGLFDNQFQNCTIGCWKDLRPRESTLEDVITFLFSSTDYNLTSNPHERNYNELYYSGSMYNGGYINAIFQDNELIHIYLQGPFNLRLSEIIDNLGKPKYFNLYVLNRNGVYEVDLQLYYPETGYVFIFFANTGIRVNEILNKDVEVCIDGSVVVSNFSVVARGSLKDTLISINPQLGELSQIDWDLRLANFKDNFMLGCLQVKIG